jgi:hypothetical protein
MCLALSLTAAVGVSVPRHKGRIGRLLVAIFTSTVVGTVSGFAATYATGRLILPSAGGNNAQAGILVFLVMFVVPPLAASAVARAFPAAKPTPQTKVPTTIKAQR